MRVLIVDPTGDGGICHYTYNLCQALAQEKLDIILATSREYALVNLAKRFKLKKIFRDVSFSYSKHLYYLPRKIIGRINLFLDYIELIIVILKTRADIVHFQWFRTYRPDFYFIYLLRILGYKTILSVHEPIPKFVNLEKYDKYASRLYRSLHKLIALTGPGKKYLITRYRVPAKSIHLAIIPQGNYLFINSISKSDFNPRQKLGFNSNEKIMLFFGRISHDKGLDLLLKAFKTVSNRIQNAKLLIAGSLIENIDPYNKLICELGLINNIQLHVKLKGIPFEDIPLYFRAADVVALPYRYCSQSGVLEIALAMGKPVVATDVGIMKSAIPKGAGFIVPPEDIEQMAERIIEILQNDDLRKQMSIKAQQAARKNRSWQTIAKDLLIVYKSL